VVAHEDDQHSVKVVQIVQLYSLSLMIFQSELGDSLSFFKR
jgi:hypothetical protein